MFNDLRYRVIWNSLLNRLDVALDPVWNLTYYVAKTRTLGDQQLDFVLNTADEGFVLRDWKYQLSKPISYGIYDVRRELLCANLVFDDCRAKTSQE